MARTHLISISFFFVMIAEVILSSSALAAERSPWFEIHSTHYTVITDAGEKKGKEVALRFEQMRAVFATLLTKERLNEPVPLTILAFNNDKSYYLSAPLRQGQPIDVPGFFLSSEDQNFIVLNLAEAEPWRAVAHEFAHLLLNYNYPPAQAWFDEGLAEYFSSIRVEDQQYAIGGDPELNPRTTQALQLDQRDARNPSQSFTELLSGQPWMPLFELLITKQNKSTDSEGSRRTRFYAQSWIVMHYVLHENKMPETGTYFDLVENQHVSAEDAIQKAYGVTPEQFDQAVKAYFQSLTPLLGAPSATKTSDTRNPPQPSQSPEIVMPNANVITAKSLPETDARALAAGVEIRVPERRDAGVRELESLAAGPIAAAPKAGEPTAADKIPKIGKKDTGNKKDTSNKKDDAESDAQLIAASGNEVAHRVLAWDHIQHADFDGAAEELSDAATLNRQDMWIRYYLSLLKYRIAQSKHTDMLGLPNMMQDLRAVLEWYPEFADAYDLLASAHREGGGPVAAMQAERAAIQLSPRNQQYVYHLAEIYMSDKKWDAARALLERLKAADDPKLAASAREQLDALANEKKYGVSATLAAAKPPAPQKSPFDVLEEDAAKRAAAAKAAQSAGTGDTRAAKFIHGKLLSVDCSQSPAAILTVSTGGATLRLRTADYKSLLLIGADEFSCAWNDRSVSVNYKPGGMSDGDLVSVEVR